MQRSSTLSRILYIAFALSAWQSTCHYGQCQSDNDNHEEHSEAHHKRDSNNNNNNNNNSNSKSSSNKRHNGDQDRFTSPTGRFSVLFQGRPEYEKMTNNNMVYNRYVHGEGDNRYFVSFADLPGAPASTQELQIWLNRYCAVAARSVGGQTSAAYSVQLAGKIPGRQLEGSIAKGVFRMRFFIVGNRLYEMYIGGTKEYVNSPVATEFLNSLTVTR
jgi:hypothetical protein